MSMFDKAKDKLGENSEKVEEAAKKGVDKVSETARHATGGKHDDKIDKVADKAKDAADKIDDQR
ncbi:Rv0909 family putative TA system antitoxin [Herbidospora cretacea]|uniref:Rv0909 family putative TA system antitoxin n=1 Tax=Herbidospora cretacea TaxID=28444 RepID=UPI0007742955|nr:Rv0909 family putative TA system antitoxin [Herbidospora cretacea]